MREMHIQALWQIFFKVSNRKEMKNVFYSIWSCENLDVAKKNLNDHNRPQIIFQKDNNLSNSKYFGDTIYINHFFFSNK